MRLSLGCYKLLLPLGNLCGTPRMEPNHAGRKSSSHREPTRSDPNTALAELHAAASRGEEGSLNRIAEILLHPMQRVLRRAFPRASPDLIANAVEDAILEYAAQPSRFDALRGIPLSAFLGHAARRNLLNLLQVEARRELREAKYAEHARFRGLRLLEGPQVNPEDSDALRRLISSLAADEAECRALLSWLNGQRTTALLATALQISHLSLAEQRKEVKRFKDRVIKRIMRRVENSLRHVGNKN